MKRLLIVTLLCLLAAAHAPAQTARTKARESSFDQDPFAAALHAIRKMEPDMSRDQTLADFVRARTGAGQYEEALEAAQLVEDAGEKALLLNHVANRLAEAGKLDRAAEAVGRVLTVLEDEVWMNNLALDALRQMVGEEETWTPEFPYATVKRKPALAYLIEDGRKSLVAPLLERARELALDPDADYDKDAFVLAGVSVRYAELGEKGEAKAALSEALDAARSVEEEDERAFALCRVAEVHIGRGDRETASKILGEAFEAGRTPRAYGGDALKSVARLYARLGLKEQAVEAVNALADDDEKALALASVEWVGVGEVGGESLAGHLARALDAAARESLDSNRSRALTRVVGFKGARAPEFLARVAESAQTVGDGYERARVLTLVADRYDELGRRDDAVKFWGDALRAVYSAPLEKKVYGPGDVRISNDEGKVELMRVLARRFVSAGEAERVPEIAAAVESNYWHALTLAEGSAADVAGADLALAEIADVLAGAGRKDLALEVLAAASRTVEHEGENVSPLLRADALASVGVVYAKAGDKVRAALYLQRALDVTGGVEDYGSHRTGMLARIGAKYAEAGLRPDARARKTLRRIVRDIEKEL